MIIAEIQFVAMYLLAFLVSITLHELAHAVIAVKLGDQTPAYQGRLSINPLDHLDLLGTTVLVITSLAGFPFGWGKAGLVMKSNFSNPRSGAILVALAGPLVNLILASGLAVIARTGYFALPNVSPWHQFILVALDLNILLALFNLIPVPPLDGAHVLTNLLSSDLSSRYSATMARWSWLLLFIVIVSGGKLIAPELMQLHVILSSS